MSIQDWAAFGEIVGAIAVVVTLLYLARQMRDSNRETRAATLQSTMYLEMEVMSKLLENAAVWGKVVTGMPLEMTPFRSGRWCLFEPALRRAPKTRKIWQYAADVFGPDANEDRRFDDENGDTPHRFGRGVSDRSWNLLSVYRARSVCAELRGRHGLA